MSQCIGGIVHDALGRVLIHHPSQRFGELFGELKSELDALQSGLARAVIPSFPPMPAVKYSDIGFGVDFHSSLLPAMPFCPVPCLCMVYDVMGAIFAAISSVLPTSPAPPQDGEEGDSISFAQSVANVGIALVRGMAPSVKVNGHWVGNAGTSIQHLPGIIAHLPFPVISPIAEGELFMGSSTVLADGSPFTYQYLPVLSCNLVGIPAPFRIKKVSKPKLSLKAPSMCLACVIPAGNPVMVGGAPTIDFFAVAMQLGLKGLGKLWKKWGSKAFDKIFGPITEKSGRYKSKIKYCLFGEPVDAITGRVFSENEEFNFPGAIPLRFIRRYYSDMEDERGDAPLGRGWHHNFDIYYQVDADGLITLRYQDGRPLGFPQLKSGGAFYHPIEHLWWRREDDHYVLYNPEEELFYHFEPFLYQDKERYSLQSICNLQGDSIRLDHSPNGRLLQVTDTAGRHFVCGYGNRDYPDRLCSIELYDEDMHYLGWSHRYGYNEQGLLSEVTDTLGARKTFEYNEHRLLCHLKNQLGGNFYWEYERHREHWRCIHTWGDGGMLEYHAQYLPGKTLATDSLGHTTTYEYNAQNLVTRIIDPEGGIQLFFYDDCEHLILSVDPLGESTKYSYDDRGRLVSQTDACGETARFSYDTSGRLVKAKSPMGDEWKREYTPFGLLKKLTLPNGAFIELVYDAQTGKLLQLIDERGATTHLEWDSAHNLSKVISPSGEYTSYQYDKLGRPTQSFTPSLGMEHYRYDLAGNLIEFEQANKNVQRFSYNAAGQVLTAEDKLRQLSFSYGILGDLLSRSEGGDNPVKYHYDTEQRLKSIHNERGEFYGLLRDGCGRIIREQGFDGRQFHYERNQGGQVVRCKTPSRTIEYSYTPLGLLSLVSHPGGLRHKYAYDRDGRLIYADNDRYQVRLIRGKGGQVLEEVQNGYSIKHSYDSSGLRLKRMSILGEDLTNAYNPLGELVETSSQLNSKLRWQASFGYDTLSREVFRKLPGELNEQRKYDPMGYLSLQHTTHRGYEVSSSSYCWDVAGRLRSILQGRYFREFLYDHRGNLTDAYYDHSDHVQRVADRIGNLYPDESYPFRKVKYDKGGRIREDQDWTYHHNEEGFLLKRVSKSVVVERYDYIKRKRFSEPQTWTYEWDGAGQLIAVSNNEQKDMGGKPVHLRFEYDALGRRTAKISVWGRSIFHRVTRFLWDGDVPLHEWTYEGSEPPKTKLTKEGHRYYPEGEPQTELTTWLFEEGTFVPLAKFVGERSYSIACDHLGTPTAAYDEAGNRVWQRELDIYGRVRQEEGETNFVPFLFQGQYYDVETKLAYNRFRYYASEWGMYISQDPIRIEAGLTNLYAYVHDTNGWIDPFGLYSDLLHSGIGHHLFPRALGTKLGIRDKIEGIRWYPNVPEGTSILHRDMHRALAANGIPLQPNRMNYSGTLDEALDSMEKAYSQFNKLEHKGFLLINGVTLDDLTPAEAMKEVKKQLTITH